MKKYMRKILMVAMVAMSAIGFNSCSDDGYSLGDFALSWATVIDEKGNSFQLDEKGEKLWVGARETTYVPKNKRVIINYTLLGDKYEGYDHVIKLNGYIADVLTKNIVYIDTNNEDTQEEMGNDPIAIQEVWEGGNYLNLNLVIKTASAGSVHYINMVGSNEIGNDGVIELELRHKLEGTAGSYLAKTNASFNLNSLRLPEGAERPETVTLRVKAPGINGEPKTYDVKYTLPTAVTPIPEPGIVEPDNSSQFR